MTIQPTSLCSSETYCRALGDELRRLRRRREWTRKDLQKRLRSNISLQTLATYELGTRHCSVVRLIELCLALDEQPETLIAKVHRRVFPDNPGCIRVSLTHVVADSQPELLPLRRWAENQLRQHKPSGSDEVLLSLAAIECMAELCAIPAADLTAHLLTLRCPNDR
ncbi:helix-turn-helix domain-containing protein [Amycolatopsis aidingensis]|uniref:helix-turn-helix domain-containing protein n=1 Tax=Amycolatopsis aidingensis TaxID=2842453 RepID=UPI001C0AC667|nr:helix-turn-helix domain-containing protein [Amycolatopsis aidingensis]